MPAHGGNRLPTQRKVLKMKPEVSGSEHEPAFFTLLIATGLLLTAYFGAAAWRLSDDSHVDVTR